MHTQTHKNPKKKPTAKKSAAAKAKPKKPEAPKKAPDVVIKATFSRDLLVPLTMTERDKRTDAYMKLKSQSAAIESKGESQREQIKAELKALEPQIESLEKVIREKAEPRKVMCEEVHDYRRGQVFVRRKDNGETVDGTERPMKHEERQQKLAGIVNEDIKNHAQAAASKPNGAANGAAKPNGKAEAAPAAEAPKNPPNWHRAANLDRKLTEQLPKVGDVWASRTVQKLGLVFRVESVAGFGDDPSGARVDLTMGKAPLQFVEARHADGTHKESLGCNDLDVANIAWSTMHTTIDVAKLWRDYALLEPVEPEKGEKGKGG